MPATRAIIVVLIALGLLGGTPAGTMLMHGFDTADIILSENIIREKNGLITSAKTLSSGELTFGYSNSLNETEEDNTGISFNNKGYTLSANQIKELDDWYSVRYSGTILSRSSSDSEAQEMINLGPVTVMRKQYEISQERGILSVEFGDQYNVLPYVVNYKQQVFIYNNYDRSLEAVLAYTISDTGIADIAPEVKTITKTLKPGPNEFDIDIPTTAITGVRLEVQPRVSYSYDGVSGAAIVPEEAIAREYDIRPNLDKAVYDPDKQVVRTKWFAGVGTKEAVKVGNGEIKAIPNTLLILGAVGIILGFIYLLGGFKK